MQFPIYLDNHATTPLDLEVFDSMKPYFLEKFGNAASKNHSYGWEAEKAVEKARKQIADFINADPKEIYFTSGATESINLAHFGTAQSYYSKGKHIISCTAEHSAVIDSLNVLEKKGFEITLLPVDNAGNISLDGLVSSLREDTILVSIMTANNEIGTIHPIKEIGKICKGKNILFHTDAAQALGKILFDVNEMIIDIASFSAHKLYGPKGIGAVYVRSNNPRVKLTPIIFGGGHENGLRSGTLNVPAIVGFGKAAEICSKILTEESLKIKSLRDKLLKEISLQIDDININGTMENRLPNNLNISFPGVKSETFIMENRKIALSTGSACTTAALKPSHVLKAIGLSDELAQASIRFGLGRFNTEEEINLAVQEIVVTVKKLRESSPSYNLKIN